MTPTGAQALEDAQVDLSQVRDDPIDFSVVGFNTLRWDALYGAVPIMNEILGLIGGRISSFQYQQTFTCLAALNVGDPVRMDGNLNVSLANATTIADAKVLGFCRFKPTPTSCLIQHYVFVAGLTGIAGDPVYLTDAGGFGNAAGSTTRILGTFISGTQALLHADCLSAQL